MASNLRYHGVERGGPWAERRQSGGVVAGTGMLNGAAVTLAAPTQTAAAARAIPSAGAGGSAAEDVLASYRARQASRAEPTAPTVRYQPLSAFMQSLTRPSNTAAAAAAGTSTLHKKRSDDLHLLSSSSRAELPKPQPYSHASRPSAEPDDDDDEEEERPTRTGWDLPFAMTRSTAKQTSGRLKRASLPAGFTSAIGSKSTASCSQAKASPTSVLPAKAQSAGRMFSARSMTSSNYYPRFSNRPSASPPIPALALNGVTAAHSSRLSSSPPVSISAAAAPTRIGSARPAQSSPTNAHAAATSRTRGGSTQLFPFDAAAASHAVASYSCSPPSHSLPPSSPPPVGSSYPISISLASCQNKASRELMEHLSRKYGWREDKDTQANLLWTDAKCARNYRSFRTLAMHSPWFKVERPLGKPFGAPQSNPPAGSPLRLTNHLPDMHVHVTKANLARSLDWFRTMYGEEFDFAPIHWDLGIPHELTELKERMERGGGGGGTGGGVPTYILKPHAGRQGEGIVLVQRWSELQSVLTSNPGRHYIASDYIADPLLLDGFKFDCRIYVLVESLQPFKVTLFKEGLARLATAKYAPPTPANLHQNYLHLTNYSLNKLNTDGFQHAREKEGSEWNDFQDESNLTELSANTASKRSIRTALLQLRLQGVPISLEQFWDDVGEIVQKTLLAMWPSLQGSYNRLFPDAANVDAVKGATTTTSTGKAHRPAGTAPPPLATKPTSRPPSAMHRPPGSATGPATPTLSPSPSTSPPRELDSDSETLVSDDDDEGGEMGASDSDEDTPASASPSISSSPSGSRTLAKPPQHPRRASPPSASSSSSPLHSPSASYFPATAPPPSLLTPGAPSHGFHLLGFDILLDEKLKCWLIEVNAAPSMNLDSSLDKRVKLAVLERAISTLGLIPPGAIFHTSNTAAAGGLGGVGSDDDDEEVDEPAEEIDTRSTHSSVSSTARYSSSSVVARPTQYRTVDYGLQNQRVTLEEKELQHTVIVRKQRKYTALDLETASLRPDVTMRAMFPFGSASLQRMYLTFTAKRYSSGLSLGAFNRLVLHYGLKTGPSSGSPLLVSQAHSLPQTGEGDLLYMRILRRTGERVMSFPSFCHAILALAALRFPHTHRQVDALTMLIQEVERKQQAAVDRAAARLLRQHHQDDARVREDDDPLSIGDHASGVSSHRGSVGPIASRLSLSGSKAAPSPVASPTLTGRMYAGPTAGTTSRLSSLLASAADYRRGTTTASGGSAGRR